MAADGRSDAGASTVFSAKLSEIGAQTALDGAESVAVAPSKAAQLRVIRRGRFRGLPNEMDANGEVQLVMVGEEFWLRFFRLKVYNNPVRDTLYLYLFRHKKVPRTVVLGGETVLIRLSGTPHGGLEDSMPDEIQMPLDNVRTKKGHPVDHSAFESMIIVRPGIKLSDGSVIPTVVHAFCEFEEVKLANLAFNKTVQGAVNNVKETQQMLESGVRATSLMGKSFLGVEKITKESFGLLGKGKKDEISFEEFKVILASLEINHTEARAYKWFVLGDVNRNGSMDLGEATFVLFVVANSKPSRLLRPRDVFLMFDTDSKPATEKDRTGSVDLIGFYECVRAFNSSVAQAMIEEVFKKQDKKHMHRLDYQQFLAGWVQLVSARAELEKRGISAKDIVGTKLSQAGAEETDEQAGFALQQALLEVLQTEDDDEDADLLAAVQRAHHARGKVRASRETGARERIKAKAETDKAVRRAKALEERARRLAAIKAEEEAAERARKETELHRRALADKQEREEQELEAVRQAALQAEEAEKEKRRRLALDRIHMQDKGLAYIPSTLWLDPASSKHLPFVITFDVSANVLVRLPEKHLFQSMGQLRKFNCSQNRLKSIPDAISTCHELLILRADDNQLETLPQMAGLDQLQILSMRGNKLTMVGSETESLQSLKKLNLSLNPLKDIHKSAFQRMRNLVQLRLESCSLEFLPADIFEANASLKELFLSGNKLRELPESMQHLQMLEQLDVAHNCLRLVPAGIGKLRRLVRLRLGNNQLRELPDSLSGLQYLLDLELDRNVLCSLPDSLGQASSLQRMTVSHNQLGGIPDVLGRLEDLQLLDVSHNRITYFPSTIGGLIRVKHIDASNNLLGQGGVTCFPQSFASLQAVEFLDVSFNHIEHISPQISGLAALVSGNFSNNNLKELAVQLCTLPFVRFLDLSFNKLKTLPTEIGMLKSLQAVDLSCNQISSLPDSVGNLQALRHLHLYNNRLNKLPLSLASLFSGLVSFDCARNPLNSLPSKFVASDVLGAGGLNLRFARSRVAGKDILKEIRDGLQRDVERERLIEADTLFDALEANRAGMRSEDLRADHWARTGTHTKLLNYSLPALWKPVDSCDGASEFRSAADQFPENLDSWWAERGQAEKARRQREKSRREQKRAAIRQQFAERSKSSGLTPVDPAGTRSGPRVSITGAFSEPSDKLQSLAQYEKMWLQEDQELEWNAEDELWIRRLHGRVLDQEEARKVSAAAEAERRQQAERERFWEAKGIEPPAKGAVPSLRTLHGAASAPETGLKEMVDTSRHNTASAESLTNKDASDSGEIFTRFDAGALSSTDTITDVSADGAIGAKPGDAESPGPARVFEHAQPENASKHQPETKEEQQPEKTEALKSDPDRELEDTLQPGSLNIEAQILDLEQEAAKLAKQLNADKAQVPKVPNGSQRKGKQDLSPRQLRELEAIEAELLHGPPAPVVGAFRRKGANGRKGGLTDSLMTPYDKGSRLHALALGKGRPGSLELSLRQTLISGKALPDVVETAHSNSRFNYKSSSMYEHHKSLKTLAQRKNQLENAFKTTFSRPKFASRFNLEAYEHFNQNMEEPLSTVDDLRKKNRGKVVGLSRFSCDDYPLYKNSTATQLASVESQSNGLESASIPTTLQAESTEQEGKQGQSVASPVDVVGASATLIKTEKRPGIKIADLPRRKKTHRYNMTQSMININPNRQTGGTAFNPALAQSKLASIQRKLLSLNQEKGALNGVDEVLAAMFESPEELVGEQSDSEVSRLRDYVIQIEQDPSIPTSSAALQEVRQLLMECAAAGSSRTGLIPDIQPRAWQPTGYGVSARDVQKKINKAKQLLVSIKVGAQASTGQAESAGTVAVPSTSGVRDDAWEVEHAELSAPSAGNARSLARTSSFGEKLTQSLWQDNPYNPAQGVGFDAAQASVLAKSDGKVSSSESKMELDLLANASLAAPSLQPSQEAPRALMAKLQNSKEDRKRSRRWQTGGQLGDHNTKPRIGEIANLAQFSNGYTPADVADYFSVQAVLYDQCVAEWLAKGGLYMEGALRLSHFISGVRRRLKHQWDASFTEAVKRFFIDTRQQGGEPTALTFEEESVELAKEQRAQQQQKLQAEHHKRVIAKIDAMWNAKADKYSVTPELLRRRMVSQEGRAAALQEFQHNSWLRQIRTESRAADTKQTQQMVGNYKLLKDERRAETARLREDAARRAQKLNRRARDKETYKALLAQGVVPTSNNPLFNHSSLTLPGGSQDSVPPIFQQQAESDSWSDGGIYEGESVQTLPQAKEEAPEQHTQDSLELFAETFLTPEEAALLSVVAPPAPVFSVANASIEAIPSTDLPPQDDQMRRKNLSAQVAGGTLLRQGSVDWAAGVAANGVSQLYAAARRSFVDGKGDRARE